MLALAGAFQFTSLKDACLDKCRHPAQFLMRYYERGVGGGFRLGARHGAFCVGCCWALMLVMFAAGVASLVWMALLTTLMVHEKTRPAGRRAVPVTGVALLGLVVDCSALLGVRGRSVIAALDRPALLDDAVLKAGDAVGLGRQIRRSSTGSGSTTRQRRGRVERVHSWAEASR